MHMHLCGYGILYKNPSLAFNGWPKAMNRVEEQEPIYFHYDVFLSFRGEDTRRNFTQSLYAALHSQGIRTFKDNVCIQPGCEITPSLFGAILDSAIAVVVISRNYANSKWCLEELVKIIDCGRLILPVFYGVNPGDVKTQKGPFEGDFRSHEKLFGDGSEQVLRWRKAFEKVGGISGWVSNDWEEAKLIQDLVRVILTKLGKTPLLVANPFDIKAIILNFVNYGSQLLRSKRSTKSSSRRSFSFRPAEEKNGVLEKPGLGEDLSSQVYGFSEISETTESLRGQKRYTKLSVTIFKSLPLHHKDTTPSVRRSKL